MSQASVTQFYPGNSDAPIGFEDDQKSSHNKFLGPNRPIADARYQNKNITSSLNERDRHFQHRSIISLDDDEAFTAESGPQETKTDALARSIRYHPTIDDELIDLEDIESFEEIGERDNDNFPSCYPELQLLRVEDVNSRNTSIPCRKNSKVKSQVYRNPIISSPFYTVASYLYKNWTLRPKKTVELRDGDFLRIQHIIRSQASEQISLRGHRLQRVRDLNGMLGKKINEACLFYEYDLDDPRSPEEQCAVEVPVEEVVRTRNLRFTNQTFPLCRNITLSEYRSKEEVAMEGGLTVRWKYTCKYATALDRHRNIYQERTLEHIRADEATGDFKISDSLRRLEWRGETTRGGAYVPETEDLYQAREKRKGSHISIHSDNSDRETGPLPSAQHRSSRSLDISPDTLCISSNMSKKRKFSSSSDSSGHGTKEDLFRGLKLRRLRREGREVLDDTRKRLSIISLQAEDSDPTQASVMADRSIEDPTICRPRSKTPGGRPGLTGLITPLEIGSAQSISEKDKASVMVPINLDIPDQPPSPSPPRMVSIGSSELSNPTPRGSIVSHSTTDRPVLRSPGQMLTYGDAFCGAGGATRGAVIAGLRVKWGFDVWEHACSSWGANFPYATCYNLAAHDFVEEARRAARDGRPDILKVDVLHLSPPCQYFSPAHTVNGADDEMNVASLFAVQAVIEVARPRVVTLEQTFGIVSVRFRYYFAALISMFTSHDFSVRWAIVPLAHWVTLPIHQSLYNLI